MTEKHATMTQARIAEILRIEDPFTAETGNWWELHAPGEWHTKLQTTVDYAEELRRKKIARLENELVNELARVKALTFKVK